jgi:tetratricopeptide (TPR) repeat protein
MGTLQIMSTTPQIFSIPSARFDVNLLPPEARKIGSNEFTAAVAIHFATEYASQGLQAVVVVNPGEISVMTLPAGADPLEFAVGLLEGGNFKEAIPFLEQLSRAHPESAPVFFNLGIAYSELTQFDEAIIRLKRAVALDPGHAHAWTGIGVAYQRSGKIPQALEAFQHAVAVAPDDGYCRRNLGGALLAMGKGTEALAHLEAAYKLLPNDPHAAYGLASAYQQFGGAARIADADELYQLIIDRWPGSPGASLAREARTELASQSMRASVGGGLRPDVVMYIKSALDTFKKVGPKQTQEIAFEIARKGQDGFDTNSPEQKYTLVTLPGKFSGLHLVAIMYTGFKLIDPTLDAGIDFQLEYDAALALSAT